MGSTPLAGLPYWELGDPPNGPSGLQAALLALEKKLVLTFTTSTARDAAITVPVAGMLVYLTTPKWLTMYDGSAWVVLESLDRIGTTCTRASTQSMTGSGLTAISWTAESTDTDAFITVPSTTVTIPAGAGGLYAISATAQMAAGIANSFMYIAAGGNNYSQPSGSVGSVGASVTRPLSAGDTVVVSIQNGGSTTNLSAARLDVYRVGP